MGDILTNIKTLKVEYCLYARKSSESDERQTMSIDSQVKEMTALAQKEGLLIKGVYQESHSAKLSGTRPELNKLLSDIRNGVFNGILTWAPDRLSRNAGDLGMLVDLMDQGKLVQIKTFSQTFSNNPNEKFLLMILCSQAKLENDQKGLNVKRGIRTKCEMGWRPCMPPLGYYSKTLNGIKHVAVDKERAPMITEMFKRVAKNGDSGRTLKTWFDKMSFTSRSGKKLSLSMIYTLLKNPFYYGEFEYPLKSGHWYKGAHEPLITKELFDQVQGQLIAPLKPKWGQKKFTYQHLFKCGSCGANIMTEEKYRKRKHREPNYHVYYFCPNRANHKCTEPYVEERRITKELVSLVNIVHPETVQITDKLKQSIEHYEKVRGEILLLQNIDPEEKPLGFKEYARYILRDGSVTEKRELVKSLASQLYLRDQKVSTSQG